MVDNVTLDAGTGGAVIRTDDDGTAHWQYVKVAFGADNTQTIVGSTSSNPLPVALSDTDNTVLDNIQTAVQLIDNPVIVDDAAFTPATTSVMMAGFEFDDTTPDSVDEGDAGAARMSANRNVYMRVRDDAGNERGLNVDANGEIGVTLANTSLPAGSNLVGDVGISGARTSGGTTFFNSNDLDETEEQVKGTAGQIYWIACYNVSASLLYLQVFNNTAAAVTVGTTPPDMVFPIPTQGDTNGAGFVLSIPNGIAMGTGITVAATTTATGAGGPGANEVLINIGYA